MTDNAPCRSALSFTADSRYRQDSILIREIFCFFLHRPCQSLWNCGKLAVFSSSCERWDGSCDQSCTSRSSKRGYRAFFMWRIFNHMLSSPSDSCQVRGFSCWLGHLWASSVDDCTTKRRRRKTASRELTQQAVLLLTSEKTNSQILDKKEELFPASTCWI